MDYGWSRDDQGGRYTNVNVRCASTRVCSVSTKSGKFRSRQQSSYPQQWRSGKHIHNIIAGIESPILDLKLFYAIKD